MIANLNPWKSIWTRPRETIKVIVHNKLGYGNIYLASMYMLQSLLFYANWWSLGLKFSSYSVLFLSILVSPLLGFTWLFFMSFIYSLTGRMLNGHAPAAHLRTVIAWAKIPTSINLLMWLVLTFLSSETVFIQDGGGPSSIFIYSIIFIVGIWSFILLLKGLAQVQKFSNWRSFTNIIFAILLSNLTLFIFFLLLRYLYY